jgi:hypothetical protein
VERVADVHLGDRVGAAVLEEEREIRHEGARKGKQYAELKSHDVRGLTVGSIGCGRRLLYSSEAT